MKNTWAFFIKCYKNYRQYLVYWAHGTQYYGLEATPAKKWGPTCAMAPKVKGR